MADLKEAKCSFIHNKLERDTVAADIQLSLLVAAASSYRHDTVLRPFPPMYQNAQDHKDHEKLQDDYARIPSFKQLCKSANEVPNLTESQIDLLHWTLNTRNFYLKSHPKTHFAEIQKLTDHSVPVPSPSHVFEVVYNEPVREKFDELRGNRPVLFAYHGSRLENFHCILNYGLANNMNKNGLFGEGIYMSSELSVCMPYAPAGQSWDKSLLGNTLGCIAMCEIIDDPSSVKCQVKAIDSSGNSGNRSRIAGSMGGEIPEKYYVVRNNDVVRIKYLLIYADSTSQRTREMSNHTILHWLSHHKFTVVLVLYGLLLLLLGFYNSKFGQSVMKKYWYRTNKH